MVNKQRNVRATISPKTVSVHTTTASPNVQASLNSQAQSPSVSYANIVRNGPSGSGEMPAPKNAFDKLSSLSDRLNAIPNIQNTIAKLEQLVLALEAEQDVHKHGMLLLRFATQNAN